MIAGRRINGYELFQSGLPRTKVGMLKVKVARIQWEGLDNPNSPCGPQIFLRGEHLNSSDWNQFLRGLPELQLSSEKALLPSSMACGRASWSILIRFPTC